MTREVFHAWLSGILEGRDVPSSVIEKVFAKIEQVYGGGQPIQPGEGVGYPVAPSAPPPPPAEMAKLYPSRNGKKLKVTKENTTPVGSIPETNEDPENPQVVRLG